MSLVQCVSCLQNKDKIVTSTNITHIIFELDFIYLPLTHSKWDSDVCLLHRTWKWSKNLIKHLKSFWQAKHDLNWLICIDFAIQLPHSNKTAVDAQIVNAIVKVVHGFLELSERTSQWWCEVFQWKYIVWDFLLCDCGYCGDCLIVFQNYW